MTKIKMTIEPKLPLPFKYLLEDKNRFEGEPYVEVTFVNEGIREEVWQCATWDTAMKLARDLLEKDVQVAMEG